MISSILANVQGGALSWPCQGKGITLLGCMCIEEHVDGRDKPGHDEWWKS